MNKAEQFSLESILNVPSVKEINELSPYAIRLANRWVREWPRKARELEAAGTLVSTLKQHAEEESLRQWRMRIQAARANPETDSSPRAH